MPVYRATVDLRFAAGAGRGTNTWTLRTLSPGTQTDYIQSLMEIVRAFYEDVQALFPTNSTFAWDGSVTELGTATPALLPSATPWSLAGSGAASSYAPAPAMVCVTWKSSLATRRGRGRTFLGPLSPGTFGTDGTIQDGNLDAVRDAAATLVSSSLNDLNGGGLAVWSDVDNIARDFIASSVRDQTAVLRSRR